MKFLHQTGNAIKGRLLYDAGEKSLSYEPVDTSPIRPLAALTASSTLQIDFEVANGQLLYAWGYLPKENWKVVHGNADVDRAKEGAVIVVMDVPPNPGMGYETSLKNTPARYLEASGHIVVGEITDADNLIKIAEGVILGLKDEQLTCIILKPHRVN